MNRLGIDVGSTTVKLILLDEEGRVVYDRYERHMSSVFTKVAELLADMYKEIGDVEVKAVITGSGGLSLSQVLGLSFEQEVVACSKAVEELIPRTDSAIELGGEDAKITFFGKSIEQRMNGTCAGGTGAFIDQMAVLLNTDAAGLNELAKDATTIYPIAARCGVFAKTDIQPLINDGAAPQDIALSIFQAVVNQTITGLACGRPIRGNVAFLGGPLSFLSELRERFIETLKLTEEQIIFPDNSRYFVAIGAALLSDKKEGIRISELAKAIENADPKLLSDSKHLPPLFENEAKYEEFKLRHDKDKIKRAELKDASGPLYLGIDAGSTTTKMALIDSERRLVHSYYMNNEGNPLEATRGMLKDLYTRLPDDAYISSCYVTGYGEGLIKAAFHADGGIIETMAHYRGANEFLPGVEFILDIGGQDMKCMRIKDGAIYNIMLNEACSSGCGSFIETYAKSVDMSVQDFAREGLFAKRPVDLGTRCTVFMNSKVKQAQKEGASIADISAGLSYSVIKNALYKVIKLRNPEDAGDKIAVQGGTFLNDSVLRSTELIFGKDIVRPDIAGLMGAYGAAIIAEDEERSSFEKLKEHKRSSLMGLSELDSFSVSSSHARCGRCQNNCLLTISKFSDGSRYITGNRCEKGAGKDAENSGLPNLYEYKFKRVFDYEPLSEAEALRGIVGIPRVLNMYENYPFWHTFFTELGYRVVLSPQSSKKIYEGGMETISSDTACYPAKLVHGHIMWLCEHDVKWIFYPSISYERVEDKSQPNHYNCPIVASYPEVISHNMDDIFKDRDVTFSHPFLPYDNDKKLVRELKLLFNGSIPDREIKRAVEKARAEDTKFKQDMRRKGEETLKYIEEHGIRGAVLCGRPYHIDPEINHGIDKLFTLYGMAVLTEDSIEHMAELPRPLRVLDQWMYHSRMYRAANYVGTREDLELVQLNSFGCGLDAVTTDEVEEIVRGHNKLYTVLKIDEGSNLGAAKIRVRSLAAAVREREKNDIKPVSKAPVYSRKLFTKTMREEGYTILMPQMAPIHFELIEKAMQVAGYHVELLPPVNKNAVDEGLRYINNDACYPTIVALGQIISALKSGKYDLDKTAIFMTQTGGGCRASNYGGMLRKALKDMKMEQIPVISVNTVGLENNPGFSLIDKDIIIGALQAAVYGDVLMRVLYRVRPYEAVEGSADRLLRSWMERLKKSLEKHKMSEFHENVRAIVRDFDSFPIREDIVKPKVGVVGEILVKYHPTANNDIVGVIEREGGEAVVLDLIDFFMYCMYSEKFNFEHMNGSFKDYFTNMAGIKAFNSIFRKSQYEALKASKRFTPPSYIWETADKASKVLSLGNQCGEGWLLTGEMVELIDMGVPNIVCLQPFACLPNHVTGKGMLKAMRDYNSYANIAAIDYDPGASEVNQLNRIKLMMAAAHKNLERRLSDGDMGA